MSPSFATREIACVHPLFYFRIRGGCTQATRETYVAETNFAKKKRKTKKNVLASSQNVQTPSLPLSFKLKHFFNAFTLLQLFSLKSGTIW